MIDDYINITSEMLDDVVVIVAMSLSYLLYIFSQFLSVVTPLILSMIPQTPRLSKTDIN